MKVEFKITFFGKSSFHRSPLLQSLRHIHIGIFFYLFPILEKLISCRKSQIPNLPVTFPPSPLECCFQSLQEPHRQFHKAFYSLVWPANSLFYSSAETLPCCSSPTSPQWSLCCSLLPSRA